jgi:DNA-binding response OmpR family regulator
MSDEPRRTALVVDDEALIRQLVARALCCQDFACELAADGDEAAQKTADRKYDLLITDLRMPNYHGYSLVRDVLQSDDPPVIIVHTAVVEPRIAADLLARGVHDIVYKPFDVELLAAKGRIFVDRKRASLARVVQSFG